MGICGHCAVAFAAKPASPKAPLGVLILAALLLDLLAIAFGFAGIEGGSVGIPWSHGLIMSLVWSAAAALVGTTIFRSARAGVVIGLVVFSHWPLDLISHPIPFDTFSWRSWHWDYGHPLSPDLPLLFGGSPRAGLGLYNHISAVAATALELAMLALGVVWYVRWIASRRKVAQGVEAGTA